MSLVGKILGNLKTAKRELSFLEKNFKGGRNVSVTEEGALVFTTANSYIEFPVEEIEGLVEILDDWYGGLYVPKNKEETCSD